MAERNVIYAPMIYPLATLSNSRIVPLVAPLSLAIFFVSLSSHMSVPHHPCLNLLTLNNLPDLHLLVSARPAFSSAYHLCMDFCSVSLPGHLEPSSQFHICPRLFCISVALLCIYSFPGQKLQFPSCIFLHITLPLIQHQLIYIFLKTKPIKYSSMKVRPNYRYF